MIFSCYSYRETFHNQIFFFKCSQKMFLVIMWEVCALRLCKILCYNVIKKKKNICRNNKRLCDPDESTLKKGLRGGMKMEICLSLFTAASNVFHCFMSPS